MNIDHQLIKFLKESNDWKSEGVPSLYFSGSGRGIQSKFEHMSNNLEICVMETCEERARVLLHFLRSIIDDNFNANCHSLIENANSDFSPENILYLVKKDDYVSSNLVTDKRFVVILDGYNGKKTITKYLHEIDVWTYSRIVYAFFDRLPKYKTFFDSLTTAQNV